MSSVAIILGQCIEVTLKSQKARACWSASKSLFENITWAWAGYRFSVHRRSGLPSLNQARWSTCCEVSSRPSVPGRLEWGLYP